MAQVKSSVVSEIGYKKEAKKNKEAASKYSFGTLGYISNMTDYCLNNSLSKNPKMSEEEKSYIMAKCTMKFGGTSSDRSYAKEVIRKYKLNK